MFYRPEDGHGLPHTPFNAIVSPRPIGWISTRGADGSENLAPYSFFNAVAYTPPQVIFASTGAKPDRDGTKDSVANIRDTGVFCANVVSQALVEPMNQSSGPWPRDMDEFTMTGVTRAPCETIACSRVAEAPAALECRMTQIVTLEGENNFLVIGTVTGVHMDDRYIKNGRFDVLSYTPVSRLGYQDYSTVTELFQMKRPGE
ncbi:flavin reductase family protein [Palleronia caenipelagi]|uniref:Flavin reductase family protein n=1 Tax=Palleronia caenipelagi TaxID=2489174 RepID=A0A547Q9K0_9RHOB|nr:flavin reductase family protein [Palleronia caenipelagi]TRD23044.1 flavin reductase family protein [Palleronia caenipelagi]